MKLSDELLDESDNLYLAIVMGLLCVSFSLYLSLNSGDAACIFLSILIGTFLASKVDTINHVISAVLFVILFLILKVPYFSWYALGLCTITAYIDEKGNDKSDEMESLSSSDKGLFYKFFKYRYALKVAVFILSLLGLFKVVFGGFLADYYFFDPWTIVYFYAFDLSYEAAGLFFKRFDYLF